MSMKKGPRDPAENGKFLSSFVHNLRFSETGKMRINKFYINTLNNYYCSLFELKVPKKYKKYYLIPSVYQAIRHFCLATMTLPISSFFSLTVNCLHISIS